jgi:hypothetical protein
MRSASREIEAAKVSDHPDLIRGRRAPVAAVILLVMALINAAAGFVAHSEYQVYEVPTRAMEKPIVRAESEQERRAQLIASGWPSSAVDAYIRYLASEETSRELQATLMRYSLGVLSFGRSLLFTNAVVCLILGGALLRRRAY